MSKRAAIFAFVLCLVLIILFIGKANAQDCPEGCPPVCESAACPENIVAHLGKYTMQSQGETKTPTNTPTITATPKPTLMPTITTLPGIIVYLNTTPELPAAPVLAATLTPLPTIATSTPQGTATPQATETLTETQSVASAHIGKSKMTLTPRAAKNIFEVAGITIQQWTLLVREWIKNPVWVTVAAILLAIFLFRTIGWLINGIIIWSRSVRGVIGPIQVEEIKDKPDIAPLMRKYLSACGASCQNPVNTTAPSATPGFSGFSAAVKEIAPIESKILSLIISLLDFLTGLSNFKKSGYSVTSNFSVEENKDIRLSVVINLLNGQKFKESRIFTGSLKDLVIKEAAYWVFWYVSGRRNIRFHLAPWVRFPTFEGYLAYQNAMSSVDLSTKNNLFKEASKTAPFNALICLNWGDQNELNNNYVYALEIYLEAIMMWPHLVGFWYRICVILDCYKTWKAQLSEPQKNSLKIKLERLGIENIRNFGNTTIDFENEKTILEYGEIVWTYAERQVDNSLGNWMEQMSHYLFRFNNRLKNSYFVANYYWKLIPFFPWNDANQFRKAILLAHCCTKIERVIQSNDKEEKLNDEKEEMSEEKENIFDGQEHSVDYEVKSIADGSWNSMDVYYNLACYYALRSSIDSPILDENIPIKSNIDKENHFDRKKIKMISMWFLKIAFKDPQYYLDMDWVKNDPDLNPLWEDSEFQALFDIPLEKTHKDFKKKDCEKKIAGLKVADAISTVIAKKEAYTYSNITPEFLMTVSKSEIDLWDSLSAFLKEPEKEQLMIHFHDLANQLYDIRLGDPILSIPPECEILSDDSIEKEQENEIDYFSIFEKINQNCDQLSKHAQDHAEDWKNKLETSKLFITHEQVPNLVDVWKIWERARAWQWVSIEKEISKFINSIKLEEKDEIESLAEAYNKLNLISD